MEIGLKKSSIYPAPVILFGVGGKGGFIKNSHGGGVRICAARVLQ